MIPDVALVKNQWLKQQIDVEFPTPESVRGCDIYFEQKQDCQYEHFVANADWVQPEELAIFKVDFHRLTVMFALLQAQAFKTEQEQALVVEFLTQIIFSEPCELYLGFVDGRAVCGGIVTHSDDALLISDLAVNTDDTHLSLDDAAQAIYQFSLSSSLSIPVYIEI